MHILYRIVTAFHVLHTGLGFKLELTKKEAWGAWNAIRAGQSSASSHGFNGFIHGAMKHGHKTS